MSLAYHDFRGLGQRLHHAIRRAEPRKRLLFPSIAHGGTSPGESRVPLGDVLRSGDHPELPRLPELADLGELVRVFRSARERDAVDRGFDRAVYPVGESSADVSPIHGRIELREEADLV